MTRLLVAVLDRKSLQEELNDVSLSPTLAGSIARFRDSLSCEGKESVSISVEEDSPWYDHPERPSYRTLTALLPCRCGDRLILPPPPPEALQGQIPWLW